MQEWPHFPSHTYRASIGASDSHDHFRHYWHKSLAKSSNVPRFLAARGVRVAPLLPHQRRRWQRRPLFVSWTHWPSFTTSYCRSRSGTSKVGPSTGNLPPVLFSLSLSQTNLSPGGQTARMRPMAGHQICTIVSGCALRAPTSEYLHLAHST